MRGRQTPCSGSRTPLVTLPDHFRRDLSKSYVVFRTLQQSRTNRICAPQQKTLAVAEKVERKLIGRSLVHASRRPTLFLAPRQRIESWSIAKLEKIRLCTIQTTKLGQVKPCCRKNAQSWQNQRVEELCDNLAWNGAKPIFSIWKTLVRQFTLRSLGQFYLDLTVEAHPKKNMPQMHSPRVL